MNKDVNIFSSCNIKYTLLILIFYFISFTEGFITTNRHGINVNHVFSPITNSHLFSRKQNHQECFLFNNTDLTNNTDVSKNTDISKNTGVTIGAECLNNLLNTTNTVPNIQPIIDDNFIKDMITPNHYINEHLIKKPSYPYNKNYTRKFKYVYAIIGAELNPMVEIIKTEIEKMTSYGSVYMWRYEVLDGVMSNITQHQVRFIKPPGVAIAYNYKFSNTMKKKLSEKNIKLIEGEKIDDIFKMARDELNSISGHNNYPRIYGKGNIVNLFKASENKNTARCYVTHGGINPYLDIRLIRGDRILFSGKISSLTTWIENPLEIPKGVDFWITIENFNDFKVGDVIESYIH